MAELAGKTVRIEYNGRTIVTSQYLDIVTFEPYTGPVFAYDEDTCEGELSETAYLENGELAIREAHSSEDDPRLGDSLSNLALYYSGVDRYAEAEPLLTRALGISEAAFGSNHPDVALKLNDLGVLYANTGRYQEAIPVYQRSLEILNALIDPDDLVEFFDT